MRRTFLLAASLFLAVTIIPALGDPVDFSENWDAYETGQIGPDYVANWPTEILPSEDPARRYPISTTKVRSPDNSLLVQNAGYNNLVPFGIHTEETLGGNLLPGQAVEGTDANPLRFEHYLYIQGPARKHSDIIVELAKGDAHAPPGGASSPEIIPVLSLSLSRSASGGKTLVSFFDGQDWHTVDSEVKGNRWVRLRMTITTGIMDMSVSNPDQTNGLKDQPRKYKGNFNRINIRALDIGVTSAYGVLDDLALVGGNIVWDPLYAPLDILPEDCPNYFVPNLKSKGRLPMTILGTEALPVADIDLSTIHIKGTVGPDAFPVKAPKIVGGDTAPGDGDCTCSVPGDDGYPDLNLLFMRSDVIDALGLAGLPEGTVVPVTVEAALLGTGRPVLATDCIEIVLP